MTRQFTLTLDQVSIKDISEVGGKNASLGEMIQNLSKQGVPVPGGYAVTASAYYYFLEQTGLKDFIKQTLDGLDSKDLKQLSSKARLIREKIIAAQFPDDLKEAIEQSQGAAEKKYGKNSDFAVRSSATAEDLPDASFAGEHETYLNISGTEAILEAIKKAMASLFTARAISYRVDKGFDHFKIALSVGVQKMARSDKACSGVMFTLDTETGFRNVVLINGSWGLGEMIVQGAVTPDEFLVFKEGLKNPKISPIISKKLGDKTKKMIYGQNQPTEIVVTNESERINFVLTDKEILQLAEWAVKIEDHYTKIHGGWTPMDLEWAKDGKTNELFIIQARPETVQAHMDRTKIKEYHLAKGGVEIVAGASVGNKIATGKARVIYSLHDIGKFQAGEILITEKTDPDWEPIMKLAAAIVTDKGGRTSHAAIVSREMGIPAVVGCKDATTKIKNGEVITVDCTSQDGKVYKGLVKFTVTEQDLRSIPQTKTNIMMNIATPETAFDKSFLPARGVGLAREEFIINSSIGIHPMALINYHQLPMKLKQKIDKLSIGYKDKTKFYVDNLAYGIAKIAAAFYPHPVIVRFSDFKTNEYRSLIGGDLYEPEEENPMIGFRGAARYYHPDFAPAFMLEIEAMKKVILEMGLSNVRAMVPFCRTIGEGQKVLKMLGENGLSKKQIKGFEIYIMCEIPSNVVLADQFLDIFDGMSIGSNDLTQLTLGIDRDGNEKIRSIANENNEAVKMLIAQVIKKCRERKKYIGICGQAPSDYPEFVRFLVEQGIESISLNPDTVVKTIMAVHKLEQKL